MRLFGHHGSEPGEFKHPRGVAVDSSGVVYVCDSYNHQHIKYLNELWTFCTSIDSTAL